MGTVNPGDGDIDFLQVISQKVGDVVTEFQLFRQQVYLMMSTAKVKTIGLYDVANFASLPTPVGPALAFVEDTQDYYIYCGGSGWKKIGTVVP
jgi:hypothetical protein